MPADYGKLQCRLELDELIDVEEVEYKSGKTGTRIAAGSRAGELSLKFTPREFAVLQQVAGKFKPMTPGRIRDYSHGAAAWRDTLDRALISYEKAGDLSLEVPK